MSILFLMEKLMKLVSTRTWKGGPSWVVLEEESAGLLHVLNRLDLVRVLR